MELGKTSYYVHVLSKRCCPCNMTIRIRVDCFRSKNLLPTSTGAMWPTDSIADRRPAVHPWRLAVYYYRFPPVLYRIYHSIFRSPRYLRSRTDCLLNSLILNYHPTPARHPSALIAIPRHPHGLVGHDLLEHRLCL